MSDRSTRETRPRLPVLFSGLALLWAVGWYSVDGSQALFVMTAICTVVALGLSIPLLKTSRSLIWSGMLLAVVALSANLTRIVPPDELDLMRSYVYDRMVTFAMIPALTALFARSNRISVTLVFVGCLPLLMLALLREHGMRGSEDWRGVVVWGGLLLPVLAGQAQRLTRPRTGDAVPAGAGEWLKRMLAPLLVLGLAFLLTAPIAEATNSAVAWAYEKMGSRMRNTGRTSNARLSLRAPPGGFAGRVRPRISIQAPDPPGYLREAAYHDFYLGEWRQNSEFKPLERRVTLPEQETNAGENIYVLMLEGDQFEGEGHAGEMQSDGLAAVQPAASPRNRLQRVAPSNAVLRLGDLRQEKKVRTEDLRDSIVREIQRMVPWQVELLSGYRGESLCLPVGALAIGLGDDERVEINRDRVVRWENRGLATGFEVFVLENTARLPPIHTAEAKGHPGNNRDLTIREPYMPAVSNWMTACEGLVDADTPIAAMRAVVRYFHDHFEYAIDGPSRGPDLLTAFMEERRGHCTLFATAATLMLRARGIPARLVGGYVCRERHAMTGRWVARERDGHAWCEAWDERSGRWRRVEATPAGGLPGNFPPPGRLRLLGEAMAGYWRAFVKWIRAANPLVSLAEAGSWLYLRLESFLGTGLGRLLLLFLMLAVPAGLGWRRRYRKRGQDESARVRAELIGAMASVERSLTPPSLRRRPDEPWTLWMQRVSPQLPKDRAAYLNDLLTAYQNIRYQPVLDISRCHEWYHLRRGRP